MLTHPFTIFEPYRDILDVRMLTRDDAVSSDTDMQRVLQTSEVASLDQVHGNRCVVLRSASNRIEKADAVATDHLGLTLTIRFADCQNFIVFAPEKNILCLIHAGWQGVRKGVIPAAFKLLQSEWGVDPKEALVAAGPSLCMKCADFTDPKSEAPELASYVQGKCIDLNHAADEQLFSLGVSTNHFERLEACTRCLPDRYWTYRGGKKEVTEGGMRNVLAATLL